MLHHIFRVHGSIPIQELDILLLVTQISVISIFVTQFSIWYHTVFSFQVKRKALKKKTQSKSIFS